MTKARPFRGATRPTGAEPLSPQRKWRAILFATLLLVLAYWAMLAGLVSASSDSDDASGVNPAAALAFGLSLVPFVFVVLAFLSEHPRAPSAVLKGMGLSLLVGLVASAIAADAVTGIVAGVGAGGVAALRADGPESWQTRAWAVALASAYTFVLVRTLGELVLLPAPIFPFTAIGLADHYSVWREAREGAGRRPSG